MSRVFSRSGGNVLKVETEADIESQCPTNFNLRSECFAAVVFNEVDDGANSMVCVPGLFETNVAGTYDRTTPCAEITDWQG
jgi:hypothetical protein